MKRALSLDKCEETSDHGRAKIATTLVVLDIGGTLFKTTHSTLRREPDWPLCRLDNYDTTTPLFFDADPVVFAWILQCLRTRSHLDLIPPPRGTPLVVLREQLSFWCLSSWYSQSLLSRRLSHPKTPLHDVLTEALEFFMNGNVLSYAADRIYIPGKTKKTGPAKWRPAVNRLLEQSMDEYIKQGLIPKEEVNDVSWVSTESFGLWCPEVTVDQCVAMWVVQEKLTFYVNEGDYGDANVSALTLAECQTKFKCTSIKDLGPHVYTCRAIMEEFDDCHQYICRQYDQAREIHTSLVDPKKRRRFLPGLRHLLHAHGHILHEANQTDVLFGLAIPAVNLQQWDYVVAPDSDTYEFGIRTPRIHKACTCIDGGQRMFATTTNPKT
jgi:hypothetical protein